MEKNFMESVNIANEEMRLWVISDAGLDCMRQKELAYAAARAEEKERKKQAKRDCVRSYLYMIGACIWAYIVSCLFFGAFGGHL